MWLFWSDSVAVIDSNSFSSLEEKRSHQTTESQSVPQHWLSRAVGAFRGWRALVHLSKPESRAELRQRN